MARIFFNGSAFSCQPGESVLETLLRHEVDVPYSCRSGACQTCLLRRSDRGGVPQTAQIGLRDSLQAQDYFLACQYHPVEDAQISLPDEVGIYAHAAVVHKEILVLNVCRLFLQPSTPMYYHAGQFISLRRHDGLARSYSLASVPHQDRHLELHVKLMPNGRMSNWIFNDLMPGETVSLQGPNGQCFYTSGSPKQPMLLIGTGTGVAPLIGVARDALASGHSGEIHLYHGSHQCEGLYLSNTLHDLQHQYANFHYTGCVSGEETANGWHPGRADEVAFATHSELKGWRVFLCGAPPMVHGARRRAFLAGAEMRHIYADAFEVTDLRRAPRD